MFNVVEENATDGDLGSGGPIVLPDMTDASGKTRHLAVGAGKDLNIYLVNRDAMGKFDPSGNQNIYQELPKVMKHNFSRPIPAYFNGRLYYASTDDTLRVLRFQNARLIAEPASQTASIFGYPGLSHELYNSNAAPSGRDHFGCGNKFITPLIANGKIYVGTTNGVGVFGLF